MTRGQGDTKRLTQVAAREARPQLSKPRSGSHCVSCGR
jgi:hypothetical protein